MVLNEYSTPLAELNDIANIRQVIPPRDLKDVGKFMPDVSQAKFVFLIDDDILYPPDYVRRSLNQIATLGPRRAVWGYHASTYLRPAFALRAKQIRALVNWYRGRPDLVRQVSFFERALERAMFVDQLGTGTVICRGSDMPPFTFMESSAKFVDVRFAGWCHGSGLDQIALPREAGWLKAVRHDETIFSEFTLHMPDHVVREIRGFAGERAHVGHIAE